MDPENDIESLRTDPFMHGNLYLTELAFQTLRKRAQLNGIFKSKFRPVTPGSFRLTFKVKR